MAWKKRKYVNENSNRANFREKSSGRSDTLSNYVNGESEPTSGKYDESDVNDVCYTSELDNIDSNFCSN